MNKRANVVFRADASVAIGTGHLMRCLTLADVLRDFGWSSHFVCIDDGSGLVEMVFRRGHGFTRLPRGAATENAVACSTPPHAAWLLSDPMVDADATAEVASRLQASHIVVDHYALDEAWHTRVRGRHPVRLVAIDDLADRFHDVDLLIDPNVGHEPSMYSHCVKEGTRILAGQRFCLLREMFLQQREGSLSRRTAHPPSHLLVFMGGVDLPDATTHVLRSLEQVRGVPHVHVLMGGAAPRLVAVRDLLNNVPYQATLRVDVENMASLMAAMDVAIGAAGSSAWERCCLGLPSVVISCADNQRTVLNALVCHGAARAVEAHDTEALVAAVQSLLDDGMERQRLSAASAALVDGLGARRVALAMRDDGPLLRRATAEDATTVFPWRNAEVTRRFFRDPLELRLESHRAWWLTRLQQTDCDLLIAEYGRVKVGVARLDIQGRAAEVSIYLDPDLHGLGLGRKILDKAREWCRAHRPTVAELLAQIDPRNLASHRAFSTAGYELWDSQWWRLKLFP